MGRWIRSKSQYAKDYTVYSVLIIWFNSAMLEVFHEVFDYSIHALITTSIYSLAIGFNLGMQASIQLRNREI